MWWFDRPLTDEEKLKKQIRLIVENYELKDNEWTGKALWVLIQFDSIIIILESWSSKDIQYISLYTSYVKYNDKYIFSSDNEEDREFLKSLIIILNNKYILREKMIEENFRKRMEAANEVKKIERQLLISEALASITWLELQKISKEVKDELNPIFDDVRRIQAITKEMEGIKKKYINI